MFKSPSRSDARRLTRSYTHCDTNRNKIPQEPSPGVEQVCKRTKISDSEQQQFGPNTPAKDSNTRNKRSSRQNVVAGSSGCHYLTPEKTIKKSSNELENLVHKKHKGAEQSSQTSVDHKVLGIPRKKQVDEFDDTHQEAESILKQTESASPRPQPYEIISHIEQQVIASVSSHVKELKKEIDKKIEEKMKHMFGDHSKTDKPKQRRGFRAFIGRKRKR